MNLSGIKEYGESLQPELVAIRRCFHAHPELRMDTPWTESRIVDYLRSFGIQDIHQGIGGHGVAAMICGEKDGKCLGIRADCDGLPIKEETGLPFASTNGSRHACGHDAHTAIALGTAKILQQFKKNLSGTVKIFFQPYEEGDGGAKLMIADGILEDPHIDAIIGMHNGCNIGSPFHAGDILVTEKATSANIFAYRATFSGTGGHVCWSNSLTNPVYMACEAVLRIKNIRKTDPRTINAVTIIQGGVRNNVIPDNCVIEGSIRSFDRIEQDRLKEEMKKIVSAVADGSGGSVSLETTIDLMETRTDKCLLDGFRRMVMEVYPKEGYKELDPVPMIGEDFARYADRIPGLYYMICGRPEGSQYPHHSSKFDLDENILSKGSILMAAFALTWKEYCQTA